MTISYREAQLIKRTAWINMKPRKPRPEDERMVPIAVRMLTYVACLNYAVCDLETELSDAGLLRQGVKRSFRMVQERVQQVHQQAYVMLDKVSGDAARRYNEQLEWMWGRIDEAVLLEAPERAYNIVVALARLVENANAALLGRYDFAPARVLSQIPGLLACAGIEDRHVDRIIEICTKDE